MVHSHLLPAKCHCLSMGTTLVNVPTSQPFPQKSSPVVQARDYHRPVFTHSSIRCFSLNHEVGCQAKLAAAVAHVSPAKRPLDDFGIIGHNGHVIPLAHELLVLPGPAIRLIGEDLHHVFLGVARLIGRPMAVGWYVELLLIVEKFQNIGWWRRIDN